MMEGSKAITSQTQPPEGFDSSEQDAALYQSHWTRVVPNKHQTQVSDILLEGRTSTPQRHALKN